MVRKPVECSFLIPVRRDVNLSDGQLHDPTVRHWLEEELDKRFGGWHVAPGEYPGSYVDPDTGERVRDRSIKYCVAVSEKKLAGLRSLLADVCVEFHQKCIYLCVEGRVEFIEAPRDGP